MKVPQRLLQLKELAEKVLKDFEWTWTTAVVFSLGLSFFAVITMAVVPSFWLYFALQKLRWGGLSGTSNWRPLLRDFIAVSLTMGPFVTVVIAAVLLQNWRRRLRGRSAERPGGGYR